MKLLYLRESTPELLPVPGVSLHRNQLHSTIFGVTLQRKLTLERKSVVNITTYHRPLLNEKSRPKRSRFIDNFWRFCQKCVIISITSIVYWFPLGGGSNAIYYYISSIWDVLRFCQCRTIKKLLTAKVLGNVTILLTKDHTI